MCFPIADRPAAGVAPAFVADHGIIGCEAIDDGVLVTGGVSGDVALQKAAGSWAGLAVPFRVEGRPECSPYLPPDWRVAGRPLESAVDSGHVVPWPHDPR